MQRKFKGLAPFVGEIKESETRKYRNRAGKLKTEITVVGDYGTQMTFDLEDRHHQTLNDFFADLTQYDIAKIEDAEREEFVRQTKTIIEEWIAQFDFVEAFRKGELDNPDPDA